MSNTDGQLALKAVEDAFQLEIARQELEYWWMGNHPKFHIFWLFTAREAANNNEVTVALQEFASFS